MKIARHLAAVALAVGAVALAWKAGGGADPSPAPPRAPDAAAPVAAKTTEAASGDVYEIAARLVEIANGARFEMTESPGLRSILHAHWRQLRPPFVPVTGEAARWVTSIALRLSPSETQWAMPLSTAKAPWAPDARMWNMNEGSFDQREALISRTPGAIAFHVTIPRGGRLTFAEGTVNATEDATAFVVTIVDGKGVAHEVYRHAVQPSGARRWHDASCDLSGYAGQDVELRLSTERAPATEPADAGAPETAVVPESEYSGPGNGKPTVDGGVVQEDLLATPAPAVALWGNPTLLAKTTPQVPYNVLWIVVDALRADVVAGMHDDEDDAGRQSAPLPPLEALLPKIPGLTPAIDELARRGARFTSAYSAGTWTRPGTLAMLAGARSSELGIETTEWLLGPGELGRFYGADPPLLSVLLRRHHVTTRAFVNNYFMAGYAPVGIDMGFERVADHRYRTRDTLEIARDAATFLQQNKDTRFFAFVNFNSPHEPYEPPARHLARIPPPPAGPSDNVARLYMAEAAKDDEAIGVVLRALEETGRRDDTIVIVTADHGETMSSAHEGKSGLENIAIRYHHAVSNFEETTKVPIVIAGPKLGPGTSVKARVRTTDIAPTVLDVLGLEPHARMSGRSLLPLVRGEKEEERVVVTEGRGSRAIIAGRWRLVVKEGAARIVTDGERTRKSDVDLFDLVDDPGERRDVAAKRPEIVAEMKARLDAALKNVAVAGAASTQGAAQLPVVHLRFAGGASPRRVSGSIRIGGAKTKAKSHDVVPIELGRDALRVDGDKIDVAFRTSPDAPVGFDLVVDPPSVPITWELWLDDQPWPEPGVYGGPFGLSAPTLRGGLGNEEARSLAHATSLPTIDTRRDVGLFVVRERRGEGTRVETSAGEGAEEMARLLREWGYAHGSGASGK